MFWEVSYIVYFNKEARVQWRLNVCRKRVADAIIAKYPGATAVKRKHRGEILDIHGSSKREIQHALAIVAASQ